MYTNIFKAVRAGDAEAVRSFLPEHGNDENYYGLSILEYACTMPDIEILEVLLKGGADPNRKGSFGHNVMYIAVKETIQAKTNDKYKFIDMLLKYGVDINAKDNEGRNILMNIYNLNSNFNTEHLVKMFNYLLDHGVDINTQDNSSRTILHFACANCPNSIVKLLVDRGADLNVKNYCGNTPLVELCKWHKRLNVKEYCEISEYMVGHGADPFIVNDDGYIPIAWDNVVLKDATNHRDVLIKLWQNYLSKQLQNNEDDIPDRDW